MKFNNMARKNKILNQDYPASLGLDFGGVIAPMTDRKKGVDGFNEAFLNKAPSQNTFDRIKSLIDVFGSNVWIISKAGQHVENLTRQWLESYNFFTATGFLKEHLYFCRERIDKKPICVDLRITHFVDDRIHIMQILKDIVPNLFLFGDKEKNRHAPRWTTLVEDWDEAYKAILNTLSQN